MPAGPAGRFVGYLPMFYGVWSFSQNKPAAKDLLYHLSEEQQARELVRVSYGYDIPGFDRLHKFDTWTTEGPPVGTIYNYPPRGDSRAYVAGLPARNSIARQIYTQALQPTMIARFVRQGESMQDVIIWAERELERYLIQSKDENLTSVAPGGSSKIVDQ
jgi:hypothetical protein